MRRNEKKKMITFIKKMSKEWIRDIEKSLRTNVRRMKKGGYDK